MCGAHPKYGSHWRQHHLTRGRGARRGAGRGVASSSWGGDGDGGDNSSWDRGGGGDFLPFVRLKGTWSEGIGCSAFADVSFHVSFHVSWERKKEKEKQKKKRKKTEDKRKKKNEKTKAGVILFFGSHHLHSGKETQENVPGDTRK